MKKLYLFLLTAIIGGTLSYMYFLGFNSENNLSENKLFSKEYRFVEESRNESSEAGKPDEYTKYFTAITTKFGDTKNNYPLNYRLSELNNAKAKSKGLKSKTSTITWTQRGPANVGGRTRGLIIDPEDASNSTWFAGAATGGIWKTTDRGQTWVCLTDNLPNLSANTIIMSESNHDIMYAGTGESFPGGSGLKGDGIFKSTNHGASWNQLPNTTTEDFSYINRMVVDPTNPDIVLAATETGIMKSTDGGTIWTKVYATENGVEDLDADPTNFNKIYGCENGVGVVLSTDAGETWNLSLTELEKGSRYELAICEANPAKIYLSINNSTPAVYRSTDYGLSWEKFKNSGVTRDLLGQGDYDNIITVHPYNEDIVYVGGVNIFMVDFSDPGTTNESSSQVIRLDELNTQSFLYLNPFSNANFGEVLGLGNESSNDVTSSDFTSVEILFGPGKTQKAHRFTVGGAGSGVADADYIYEDYVDVPFEVWDVTNGKQLMVSFRDQEENSVFDLDQFDPEDGSVGREYLFIHAIDYAETASPDIATNGGHAYKQTYFLWCKLPEDGATWDESNLPDSKVKIEYGTFKQVTGTITTVADAYGSVNNYNQGAGIGTTSIPGLHPDHHNLIMIKTDEANEKFHIINANDGGLGISEDEGQTFTQLPNNYITTQFYGVAKRPEANEYIGGMQDNGTWATPDGVNSSVTTDYIFHLGGDGFECVWHSKDADKIIGSIYYNSFYKTTDGGENWTYGYMGIETVNSFGQSQLDGPFISHISNHKNDPDVLFAVGYNGIYKSTNFASDWKKVVINDGWNSERFLENYYVTSQHNVEVSLANENIVWAGAAMNSASGWKLNVSTDQGETFSPVNELSGADLSGYISGIATHPTEDSTAYVLFSFPEETKVIRTTDLGQTWEDISGYNGNTTSSNGFPDVVTHCLVVMPYDPSTIWVGTDIGIFESTDNGVSWHILDSDLPAVSVYDMFVQDGQVVLATHGRGIWTASITELNYVIDIKSGDYPGEQRVSINYSISEDVDSAYLFVDTKYSNKVITLPAGTHTSTGAIDTEGEHVVYMESYFNGETYRSNSYRIVADFKPVINSVAAAFANNTIEINAILNENYDSVQIHLNDQYNSSISSFDLGNTNIYTTISSTGTFDVKLIGFISDIPYESNTKDLYIVYTGISDMNNVNDLKVYPNPTRGNITIELPDEFNEDYDLKIYSLSGTQVYSAKINKSENRINIEELKDGLYIINIENNGKIYSQKVQLRK